MDDFSKYRNRSHFLMRFFLRSVGVLVLMFIAFVMVRASYNMYGKFSQAAEAQKSAQDRLALLVEQKEQVGTAVEAFDSQRGIEAEVRERYGVAKPGEGKLEIVRESPTSSPQEASSQNVFVRFFDFLGPF